jgi:hypothetical protein
MWIIIDDAQHRYSNMYKYLWSFLIKDVKHNPNIKVIISATHNMTTLGSPAAIGLDCPMCLTTSPARRHQVSRLIWTFCMSYADERYTEWGGYWSMMKEMSLLKDGKFHVGVIMTFLS